MLSEGNNVSSAMHRKLMSDIGEIVKVQHIKKPVRSEPALKNSEFHLVKKNFKDSVVDSEGIPLEPNADASVSISSVAKTIHKNTKQKSIGNQLKNVFKHENVLVKPLEKSQAETIERSVAYDNTKQSLARWDAVVTKNQHSEQLRFPMMLDKTTIKDQSSDVSQFRFKTKLMREMEEIRASSQVKPSAPKAQRGEDTELLTLEEMKERRNELRRLRMKESQKIVKKRMDGKIKSKKYHKLKKREELKRKMKEFEELKTINPELAIKELEKIEKQRVRERTTLRHKNTGTWAKNLQVRAKYDSNVKQDLEAQLALGRELTQKQQQEETSDSEEEEMVIETLETNNPWVKSQEDGDSLDENFSGYKKFWEEHNTNSVLLKKYKSTEVEDQNEDEDEDEEEEEIAKIENEEEESINDIFDEIEETMKRKINDKLLSLKPKLLTESSKKQKKDKKQKRSLDVSSGKYLGFAKKTKLADVDEALDENGEGSDEEVGSRKRSKSLLKEVKQKKLLKSQEIKPELFLNVKSKHLMTALPRQQGIDGDENENDLIQLTLANKMSLAEAFESDDIVNDFEEEIEAPKLNQVVEDQVPGWGNWAGHGLKPRKQKVIKAQEIKKKDRIIRSTAANEKLQQHLVSSVPFPFKSIEDFEASIRLPVGRDFVPETAHRKLVMPSIVTKAGTIIEPMSENILVKNKGKNSKSLKKTSKKIMKSRKIS